MSVTVTQVVTAGRKAQDWPMFIKPWATEALKRALQSPRDPSSGTDKVLVLPPFAVKEVRGAISHINKTTARLEREQENVRRPSGKFA
jgi:hypothetical protein